MFYPDATERAERHKRLCQQYGFVPLHPIDQPSITAEVIYRTNIDMLRQADAVLANLNPFRGAEVDSGTAFEVGFAIASGKPVMGYVASPESLHDRVARLFGPLRLVNAIPRDANDALVEDFGHPVNLMLAESCQIVIGDLEQALKVLQLHFGRLTQ